MNDSLTLDVLNTRPLDLALLNTLTCLLSFDADKMLDESADVDKVQYSILMNKVLSLLSDALVEYGTIDKELNIDSLRISMSVSMLAEGALPNKEMPAFTLFYFLRDSALAEKEGASSSVRQLIEQAQSSYVSILKKLGVLAIMQAMDGLHDNMNRYTSFALVMESAAKGSHQVAPETVRVTNAWRNEAQAFNGLQEAKHSVMNAGIKMESSIQSQSKPVAAERLSSNSEKKGSFSFLILIGYLGLPIVPLALIFGALVAMDVLPNTEEVTNLCISLDVIIGIAAYIISMILARSSDK